MKPIRSLRTQLALGAALLAIIVVALSGLTIAIRIDHQDRAQVDRQLRERAAKVQTDAGKPGSILGENDKPGGARNDANLLAGTDTITRVLDSTGQLVVQRGEGIRSTQPVQARTGVWTVAIDGRDWRSLVEPTAIVPGGRLQVLQSLAPVEQRLHDNARVIALVAIAATVVSAVLAWLTAGLLLRPLERLRAGAARLRPGDGDQRLPNPRGQQEVTELTATLNTMLERLQRSMQATRRFTADAGHELRSPLTSLGMDLETLRDDRSLSDGRRAEILDAMTHEHARLTTLLDGLQQLARGDAEALASRDTIDVTELVTTAMRAARRRHPAVHYASEPAPPIFLDGWSGGLRLALDNLLDNAALHGDPHGHVDVTVTAGDGVLQIDVDDDGPGIPAGARERMTQRFARGDHPRSGGSGLGLALVDQQARLHNGTLTLGDARGGGLRATMTIPVTDDVAASGEPASEQIGERHALERRADGRTERGPDLLEP